MLLKGVILAPLSNSNLEMLKASLRAFLEAQERGEKGAFFGDEPSPHYDHIHPLFTTIPKIPFFLHLCYLLAKSTHSHLKIMSWPN